MKNISFIILLLLSIFLSCVSKPDPFLVTSQSVGRLNDSTTIAALVQAFEKDSIVSPIGGDEFFGNTNVIKIYDTSTKEILLELSPKEALDSLSTIQTVRILNDKYKTKKGLNKNSTFGVITKNYTISNIQNTLRNIIVSTDEINAYFTIDKSELPEELRFDMSKEIDIISIPEKAKIKDFYIQWY